MSASESAHIEPAPDAEPRSYVATHVVGPLLGKVPLGDVQAFFRQFSAMQNAGLPGAVLFDALARQSHQPKLRRIAEELRALALAGKPASEGLQRYHEVFTPVIVSLIRAGEEGGYLAAALTQAADYLQTEQEIRLIYRKATLYPKMVVGASIVLIVAANAIIASMGKKSFLASPLTEPVTWVFLGPLLVFAFLYFRVGLANPRVRYNWDRFTLLVPYVGSTLHQFAMAKFGRALAALHKAGVPPQRSVELAADACGNEWLRSRLHPAGARLKEGYAFAETLADTHALSPIALQMVSTGETSGDLETMLTRFSEFYEEEAKTRSAQLGVVTGVAALFLVGGYVAYIAFTFFSGLYGGLRDEMQDAQSQQGAP